MRTTTLTSKQLGLLFNRVFKIRGRDRMAIMIDLPHGKFPDSKDWAWLRKTARQWRDSYPRSGEFAMERVVVLVYPATGNGNLPEQVAVCNFEFDPGSAVELRYIQTREALAEYNIVLAMTNFSVTVVLKALAKELGFRGATMPGFTEAMMPGLFLDYEMVARRVGVVHALLSRAVGAKVRFETKSGEKHDLFFDLRFNKAQASTGRYTEDGEVGNFPSGEAYIAPYVGKRPPSKPSRTSGIWPVMYPGGLVLFWVEGGRMVGTVNDDDVSREAWKPFAEEPGRSWIAELGLGVLDGQPVGGLLWDEKLEGIHIARGLSAHGGEITKNDFNDPNKAQHVDVIYTGGRQVIGSETLQFAVGVAVTLVFRNGNMRTIMVDGKYVDGLF
jgi:leucyl aminopeptidase (aminopeptidase T)